MYFKLLTGKPFLVMQFLNCLKSILLCLIKLTLVIPQTEYLSVVTIFGKMQSVLSPNQDLIPINMYVLHLLVMDERGPSRVLYIGSTNDVTRLQGPEHSQFFVHNVEALANRKFYYAGQLVAISLANGRPSLNCLAEAVYEYFCHGLQCKITPNISLIPDCDIQESLKQVRHTLTH